MKSKILVFWGAIILATIGFLLNKVIILEKRIDEIYYYKTESSNEHEYMRYIDEQILTISNSISEIKGQYSLVSKAYNDMINQIDLDELELQLDKLQKNNLYDISANVETLNIRMEILNKIISKSNEAEILHIQYLYDFESNNNSKMIMVSADDIDPQKLEISSTCKFYIGSDYHRYETTLKNLLTPQEPLESNGFTIIILNDVIEYILTGKVY